jgi:hypothetical protein
MTNSENPQVVSSSRPIRERVGLIVDGANAAAAVKTIVAADKMLEFGRYGCYSHLTCQMY